MACYKEIPHEEKHEGRKKLITIRGKFLKNLLSYLYVLKYTYNFIHEISPCLYYFRKK